MITAQTIVDLVANGSRMYGMRITDRLYGPDAASIRRTIMSGLIGKPVPKSKCGASAVRAALADAYGIDLHTDCLSAADDKLDYAIRAAAKAESLQVLVERERRDFASEPDPDLTFYDRWVLP